MKVLRLHRVLASDVAKWVADGWSVVHEDRTSPSLTAQGDHVVLLEKSEDMPERKDE